MTLEGLPIRGHESALVVLAPEAESLAGPCRALHDPSAAWGVPAHITVLYPFKPPEAVTDDDRAALRRLFAHFPGFAYALTSVQRFPNAVYLAPEPAAPFRALTEAVALLYPEYPPYAGEFEEVIPHLTLAYSRDPVRLDQIANEFSRTCLGKLPVRADARSVVLMDDMDGRWRVRESFPLAAPLDAEA